MEFAEGSKGCLKASLEAGSSSNRALGEGERFADGAAGGETHRGGAGGLSARRGRGTRMGVVADHELSSRRGAWRLAEQETTPSRTTKPSVSVAAEVGQHLGRTAEGRLGIGDPVHLAQLGEPMCEDGGVRQRRQLAKEPQLAGPEGGLHSFKEEAAEQA